MAVVMKGGSIVNLGGDGLVILGSKNVEVDGVEITAISPIDQYVGARRNWPCPCGSGKKYKRCHEGVKKVATGIKSYNSEATFDGTKIVTDGVGIELDSDRSKFNNTVIIAGAEVDYVALARQWGLPEEVPIEHVKQAVEDVRKTKNPSVLETSRLKAFLADNGFNMACWAQIALSIVTYCFAPT
ncbi:SEC-C domain-containing protein [Pseudomonas putida]